MCHIFRRAIPIALLLGVSQSARSDSKSIRDDPSLAAQVSIVEVDPDLLKVLSILENATGLTLRLDESLASHRAKLGGFAFRSTPAWVIMELLAKIDLDHGRWEKTTDGYRLTARASKAVKHPEAKVGSTTHAQKNLPKDLHVRTDPKLQAKLSVGTRPTLEAILRDLEQATRLKFTLADDLQSHAPDFGKVHLGNVPAWMIMALVTENQMQDGRWEKTETGYRLDGKSLVPRPPSDISTWVIICWALAGVLVLASLYLLRRRLARREKLTTLAAK